MLDLQTRDLLTPFIMLIIALLIGGSVWTIGRKINYTLSYRGQVEETIRILVKPECLIAQ
jgi:hypothetical protein